jgi:nicotinamide-nucleotide amidase
MEARPGRAKGAGNVIETFDDPLPRDIHQRAIGLMQAVCDKGLKLALAESCTGGLLAAVLTDVEGCSHGFERGFVAYTDDAKQQLLAVPPTILAFDGAVSEAAARAMAEGALAASNADLALAVTGFAGPGAPDEEPGLVFLTAARRSGVVAVLERHYGDASRARVRLECLRDGIDLLRAHL